ncbi:hypothetical protein BASA81_003028 [Batrachochytrium salamandrivorans]|nr:hypothetical protein BASA81_003028 [Batrachochytrium salamandrivorans]
MGPVMLYWQFAWLDQAWREIKEAAGGESRTLSIGVYVKALPLVRTAARPSLRMATNTTNSTLIMSSQNFLLVHANLSIVVVVYPFTEYGLLCNNVHQIAAAVDVVLAMPRTDAVLALAFETRMGNLVKSALDVEYLQYMLARAGQVRIQSLNPGFAFFPKIHLLLDWSSVLTQDQPPNQVVVFTLSPKRFQQKYGYQFSFAVALFVKPHWRLRLKAEEFLEANPLALVSIHRRTFAWCTPAYKKYSAFCAQSSPASSSWMERRYFENDCNVTWTPYLQQSLLANWPSLPTNYTILLASDLHDRVGDSTFPQTISIPHQENHEHYIAEELVNLTRYGINSNTSLKKLVLARTGLDMNWDLSMLVDMWAQVLTPFSIGQPYSSCDRILAMWRSPYSRAMFDLPQHHYNFSQALQSHLDLSETANILSTTYPPACYAGFERPTTNNSLEVVRKMRLWWHEWGLKHIPQAKRSPFTFPPFSVEQIPVKTVELWLLGLIGSFTINLGRLRSVYFFTPMAFGLVLFDYTNKSRNAKWGLDSEGRMLGSEQTSRVMNDQAKLSESKARLEQVFADSNVSRPSQE